MPGVAWMWCSGRASRGTVRLLSIGDPQAASASSVFSRYYPGMDERQPRDWWRRTRAGKRARYIQGVLAGGCIIVLLLVHNILADLAALCVFFFYAVRCVRLSRRWAAEADRPDVDRGSGEPTGQ